MKLKHILIILLAFSTSIFAQSSLVGLTYGLSVPLSKTSDYIGDLSYVGFNFDARKSIGKNTMVGLCFGWNVFAEETSELVHIENEEIGGDLSGNQGRYINSFPILVNLTYMFKGSSRSSFVPYIGLNTGVYLIQQRFNIGVYQFDNNNTHFGTAPEVGFLLKASSVNILFYTRYNYAFDAGTRMNGEDKNDHSYISFNIGIAYDKVGF